jgi:transcriptional regulator with XRE-family HTH domain
MVLPHELGRAVRALREQKGWSQRDLADAARMTQPAVARFEAGGTTPTLPVLERLAAVLGGDLVVRLDPRRLQRDEQFIQVGPSSAPSAQ